MVARTANASVSPKMATTPRSSKDQKEVDAAEASEFTSIDLFLGRGKMLGPQGPNPRRLLGHIYCFKGDRETFSRWSSSRKKSSSVTHHERTKSHPQHLETEEHSDALYCLGCGVGDVARIYEGETCQLFGHYSGPSTRISLIASPAFSRLPGFDGTLIE